VINVARLKELAPKASYALDIGKAAEHLVCANLILLGHRCFLSDQGMPYDVVCDYNGRLIRIQVRASCFPRNANMQGRAERLAYLFYPCRNGKNGKTKLDTTHCDIIALVALDVCKIAYFPISEVGTTCQLMPVGFEFKGKFKRSRYAAIDSFPFEAAMERLG
jgi:hypothetical protein